MGPITYRCVNCGTEVEYPFDPCPHCGESIETELVRIWANTKEEVHNCLNCGEDLDNEWDTCPNCGEEWEL